MPRRGRELVAGGIYHVVARGVEQRDVFLDDTDRLRFLAILETVVTHLRWSCLTYCLMNNHYHLVLKTPEPDLSLGMRDVNGIYARRFNERYRRVGHLFQDRYRARLITRERHLFATVRYIALNPVRAGICSAPDQWEWSSHRAIIGAVAPGCVAVSELLSQFTGAFGGTPGSNKPYIELVSPS